MARKKRGNKQRRSWLARVSSQQGTCVRKEGAFADKAEAEQALARMKQSPHFVVREGRVLEVYRCTGCSLFHLGHRWLSWQAVKRRTA